MEDILYIYNYLNCYIGWMRSEHYSHVTDFRRLCIICNLLSRPEFQSEQQLINHMVSFASF